jgi:serine/threonine protein kinase
MPESPELMTSPSTIAHYRITSKLGEGGMGAVYRATDTKLNRDVAIKILPDAFAQDLGRMARFEREAKFLASLNHPHIAAIYGVEERALVMELVEGAELRGPLSPEQALPVIHQLIDALEYAHEKGIVHRDLKPANIKVTPEGNLKLLDFGLAKNALWTFVTFFCGLGGDLISYCAQAFDSKRHHMNAGVVRREQMLAFRSIL